MPQDLTALLKEVQQAILELEVAKDFLHESGTDPEAWIDGVLDRLRAIVVTVGPVDWSAE